MGFFRANSVTWNPHKMMGVPLQCSAILVREKVQKQFSKSFFWRLLRDMRMTTVTKSFCVTETL